MADLLCHPSNPPPPAPQSNSSGSRGKSREANSGSRMGSAGSQRSKSPGRSGAQGNKKAEESRGAASAGHSQPGGAHAATAGGGSAAAGDTAPGESVRGHQQVVMKHVLDQDLRMDLAGKQETSAAFSYNIIIPKRMGGERERDALSISRTHRKDGFIFGRLVATSKGFRRPLQKSGRAHCPPHHLAVWQDARVTAIPAKRKAIFEDQRTREAPSEYSTPTACSALPLQLCASPPLFVLFRTSPSPPPSRVQGRPDSAGGSKAARAGTKGDEGRAPRPRIQPFAGSAGA